MVVRRADPVPNNGPGGVIGLEPAFGAPPFGDLAGTDRPIGVAKHREDEPPNRSLLRPVLAYIALVAIGLGEQGDSAVQVVHVRRDRAEIGFQLVAEPYKLRLFGL